MDHRQPADRGEDKHRNRSIDADARQLRPVEEPRRRRGKSLHQCHSERQVRGKMAELNKVKFKAAKKHVSP